MGGLIQTKGTMRLVAHYNNEFSTFFSIYTAPAKSNLFNRNSGTNPNAAGGHIDLWGITQTLTDPHSTRPDNKCLLPPDDRVNHHNLLPRWKFFLQNTLAQANRDALADQILVGLNFGGAATAYESICFDVTPDANQSISGFASATDPSIYYVTIHTLEMPVVGPHRNDPPPLD
jgi:hypothetical protein